MSLIAIPTADDYPDDLKSERAGAMRFELPEIDRSIFDKANVVGFNVLVLPVRPPKKFGEIELVVDSIENMKIMRTIGVVVKVGPLAYSQKRGWEPGELERLGLADYDSSKEVWAIFKPYAGMDIPIASDDGRTMETVKALHDSEIIILTQDESLLQRFTVVI